MCICATAGNIIFATVGAIIQLYFLLFRFSSRGFALPSLFMNAGNMGIPLTMFAFGAEGLVDHAIRSRLAGFQDETGEQHLVHHGSGCAASGQRLECLLRVAGRRILERDTARFLEPLECRLG